MESADFPWYFNPTVVTAPPKIDTYFQFTHFFYRKGMWCSDHSWVLKPILEKIKPLSILRIKANLNPRETKHIEHGFHNDFAFTDNAKITTAIFYVNTNNGYTLFENGDKVKSVKQILGVSFLQQENTRALLALMKEKDSNKFQFL